MPQPQPTRLCPSCQQTRSLSELYCDAILDNGVTCGWSLLHVPISYDAPAEDSPQAVATVVDSTDNPTQFTPHCVNGHPATTDDFICLECGADIVLTAPDINNTTEITTSLSVDSSTHEPIHHWHIDEVLTSLHSEQTFYAVSHEETNVRGFLILYPEQHKTDPAIYSLLKKTHHNHIPELLETGHWQQCFYEVHEWIDGGDISDREYFTPEDIDAVVKELGSALHALSVLEIRHRNINPNTVLIRTQDPLDLVITDFSCARLSDFDLETVASLALSRYSAPETIVGAVSVASDWWGLGIILLEQLTHGACFDQVNDKAFMMHVVTRSIDIPEHLEPRFAHLLAGLLARDPQQRWQWQEVQQWLEGNPPPAPDRYAHEQQMRNSIQLNQHAVFSPEQFALLGAQHEHWQAGNEHFVQGRLATWCEKNLNNSTIASQLRQLRDDAILEPAYSEAPEINQDFKYALALMIINPSIPLTYHGDIITPSWLMPNAALSYRLLNSRVMDYLESMKREPWLTHLKSRMEGIRTRSQFLEITLVERKFQLMALATSRANLDAQYTLLREIYPDAQQAGLIELLDKPRLNDDELILLLSADTAEMTPLEETLQDAKALAHQHDILVFDEHIARQQLIQLRTVLYQQVSQISSHFSRCGHAILDGWVDDFRLQGRLKLPRLLVLLSIPEEQWQQPEKQEYLNNLFHFFEKRVINNVLRGSLVRLTIGKTTAKIDLTELDTGLSRAKNLLEHILDRGQTALAIDPTAYQNQALLKRRLDRTVSQARTYRQETGIDSLYIGFPFLLRKDAHKTTRPRIAPLLLWPVALELDGATYTLRFASEREEIRLNPALESLLPANDYEALINTRQTLLRRDDINIQTVLDNFGSLFPLRHQQLCKHPAIDLSLARGETLIEASAVLFNATFVGQSISEDLRRLRQLPIQDTALAAAFQVQTDDDSDEADNTQAAVNAHSCPAYVSENDKYFITNADPSQAQAILKSRDTPGLLIEGPPGTGKSQTIVNIISDCIGRKENVLVICQKQAALQVVAKRLEAGSLQNRFLMINDINRDRQPTIRTLREQLDDRSNNTSPPAQHIESRRHDLANKIDRLEERLNDYHHYLYARDSTSDHSFRQILNELIRLEEQYGDRILDLPEIRHLLEATTPDQLNSLLEDIEPLAPNWLHSDYENSPLHVLKIFPTDAALVLTLNNALTRFAAIEHQRQEVLTNVSADFDEGNDTQANRHQAYTQWKNQYSALFSSFDDKQREQVAAWFSLFNDEVNTHSEGADILQRVMQLQQQLMAQKDKLYDAVISPILQNQRLKQVKQWHNAGRFFQKPVRWYSGFNPMRLLHAHRLSALNEQLSTHSSTIDPHDTTHLNLLNNACELELSARPARQSLIKIAQRLDYAPPLNSLSLKSLRQATQTLIDALQRSQQVALAVASCPRKQDAPYFIQSASQQAYDAFFNKFSAAIERASARETSLTGLQALTPWFEPAWMQRSTQLIIENQHQTDTLQALIAASPTVQVFQHFRLKTQDKPTLLFDLFAQLRHKQAALNTIDSADIGQVLRQSIRCEALLSWKNRLEREHPALLINKQDAESTVAELASASDTARDVTQHVLKHNIDPERLGTSKHWEAITRLRGVRYKKLREFIDEGMDLGLMEIRPVWLMNPEVASQALPLKANLFDVVIYDEASQLMVDYAIPSLYRAKRAIISGDEKQMPPTSFFASKVDSDEDLSLLELDDDLSPSEQAQQQEAWERHEIKDQSDLLSLGRTFLPSTTLQIHYRSRYESLITYSNHAFYNGQLNVPRKHPLTEIRRAKPLELIQVNGEYIEQTNPTEASRIVQIINDYWLKPEAQRPTIGVVTFNKKQAELITECIQQYANDTPHFNAAYLTQSQRLEDGEDMGFFVKNVENVQGDERDVMIFSTTFGYDANGSFYRRFGALGQSGGERRLNVAITRAKQKVILVTSMPIHKISDALATGRAPDKPRDYLQLYLDFASKISGGEIELAKLGVEKYSSKPLSNTATTTQDSFVRSVAHYLTSCGFAVTLGSESDDSFQLDLAIEDPQTGLFALGVECDSPQHSLLGSASAREIWRPFVLKQSIKQIHRINSRDWYHHREAEQTNLITVLQQSLCGEMPETMDTLMDTLVDDVTVPATLYETPHLENTQTSSSGESS